jgi:IS605 OrfB family transposase
MRKSFKYRLYPTKEQQRLLECQLEECRWLYNRLLEERKTAWEQRQESLRLYDQQASLPALKALRPTLVAVQSQVLQNVAARIDLAFQAFFRRVVARIHERIEWRRGDFAHQQSRRIVNAFDLIAVEDLSVNRMTHNHCLAKSIHDAAWTQFAAYLAHKAAWAGRRFVAVNPAYTSQDCSGCGHRQPVSLSDRIYTCPCCGLVIDRDHNAAKNILRLARARLGLGQQSLASA